ncbi:MAG: NADH:ubiquinone reductase (Na(+)-transporting) subunit A, partial [Gammaproteobacteria bacterium]|nr:NADH:ubiquinone reductase (Na(+)-transporting) subunit A [Gammaproteobacteria bacterium]
TAIDTRPHAPDPEVVIASDAPALHAGLDVIGRLTDGKVHVCSQAGSELRIRETDQRRHAHFDGPHPAGLPGTHIHFLHPVGHDCSVWHIGYQDVIAIGRLFLTGRQDFSRVVALSGPPLRRPRLVRTRIGASLQDLAGPADGCRIVSGSVLDGRMASGNLAFLGRYHLQASLIPQARDRRLLGWLRRGDATTTARRGEPCAMIPCEAFDAVMPLDLLPGPLLKSLLVGDAREAARLGCLELDEEDLALVGWSCPAKIDYAAALRSTLDAIWKER